MNKIHRLNKKITEGIHTNFHFFCILANSNTECSIISKLAHTEKVGCGTWVYTLLMRDVPFGLALDSSGSFLQNDRNKHCGSLKMPTRVDKVFILFTAILTDIKAQTNFSGFQDDGNCL